MRICGQRVLVTGGAGFIGSHLVELLAPTNRVTVVDSLTSGSAENLVRARELGDVLLIDADIRQSRLMARLMRETDVVFHLAVICLRESIGTPEAAHEVNATATLQLLGIAQAAGVKRFVYCSSSEVYGTVVRDPMSEDHPLDPATVYGASKLAGEKYTLAYHKTYGFDCIVVRPFNTYGPRSHYEGFSGEAIPRFVINALAGRPLIIHGDGEQTRDFTYVTDAARGILLAAECDRLTGDVVNIACGTEASVNALAVKIIEQTGSSSPVEHVEGRPGDVRRHHADISKARKLLGYEPRIPIDEGLYLTVEWMRGNIGDLETAARSIEEHNW